MRVYGEVAFNIIYLLLVIALGFGLIRGAGSLEDRAAFFRLFGAAALVLGIGDAFHLVPRVLALLGTGEAVNSPTLGLGKLITSITMTVFYVMLFFIWKQRYGGGDAGAALTWAVLALAAARIALCLFPQNQWFALNPPLNWGIYRNIPFAILGALMAYLFFIKRGAFPPFSLMWLAIALSFAFYIPVVLLAGRHPAVGALMLPKTACYVWIVLMGVAARADALA